jgi:hypothetical protein
VGGVFPPQFKNPPSRHLCGDEAHRKKGVPFFPFMISLAHTHTHTHPLCTWISGGVKALSLPCVIFLSCGVRCLEVYVY